MKASTTQYYYGAVEDNAMNDDFDLQQQATITIGSITPVVTSSVDKIQKWGKVKASMAMALLFASIAGVYVVGDQLSRVATGSKAFEMPTALYAYEFKMDSCSAASTAVRTTCCTDPNYPVLGGVDVVALRSIRGGMPPLVGDIEYAAALPTSQGTYVFLFASAENREKFLSDPWAYAPLWGGFDAWEIVNNRQLKGETAKTNLGPNTDLSLWMTAVQSKKLAMFGNTEGKNLYLGDVSHYENQGNRKWEEWFGGENDGPFNTKCFQGFTYEEAADAKEGYASGTISGAPPEGDGVELLRALGKLDDKARRRGAGAGELFLVHMGAGRVERAWLEEGTGRGFRVEAVVEGSPSPKDVALDADGGYVYWTDMVEGTVRRVAADARGAAAAEAQLVVGDQPKPALLALNPAANRLYYTAYKEGGAEVGQQKAKGAAEAGAAVSDFVIRWSSMDGSMPGTDGNALVELPPGGQCRGLAVGADRKYLYWTDYFGGTLNRFELLAPGGSPSETLLAGLDSPSYVEVRGDRVYWVEGSYGGERLRFADLAGPAAGGALEPRTLLGGLNVVDGVAVEGDALYWTDKDGAVLAAALPALLALAEGERALGGAAVEAAAAVRGVMEGLDRPKGLKVRAWPAPAGLSLTAETKYTERGDPPVYADYPWATGPIVEPYLPTTLRVAGAREGAEAEGYRYEMVYNGKAYATKAIKITPRAVGEIPVTVRELDAATGTVVRELRGGVYCKYVRREIRALTEEDREAFLRGMETMVRTDLLEGRERYGPRFKNNEYFVHMHNVLAGARDCDHLHNGKGFLFNHVLLTNEFEEALQLINPALTVPYWDFTVEGHDMYFNQPDGGGFDNLWNSVIFDPDWFGDADNEHHTVTEGRWAWSLKVADEQWDNQVHNSFGMMRAPWNQNKFPYVQRYRTMAGVTVNAIHEGWPTCEYHHYVLAAHTIWTDFASHIASEPHGTVHGILGGTFGNEAAYDSLLDLGIDAEDVFNLKAHSFRSPKSLWRMGLATCPEFCDPDLVAQEDCKCTCGEDILEKLEDEGLRNTYARAALTSNGKFGGDGQYSVEQVKQAVKIVCEAGTLVGDELESASPADPLFWPIHPTVDRLFFWKMLKGGFENTYWPEDGNYMGAVYGGLNANQQCHGHQPDDLLPFTLNMDDGDSTPKRAYTNRDMLTIGDPSSPSFILPYVYDGYSWDHCLEEGYDFDVINTL